MTSLNVIFVHSEQPIIYRGWIPEDAAAELNRLGIHTQSVFISALEELRSKIVYPEQTLVWPVCYTVGADPNGPLLAALLEEHGIPYIGLAAETLRYSSKLRFKDAVAQRTAYRTPAYGSYSAETRTFAVDIPFPAMVKTEYSCNSEGVWFANNRIEAEELAQSAHSQTGQAVFLEQWERHCEYTIGYIAGFGEAAPLAAAMTMTLLDERPYVDREAKNDNTLLQFSRPDPDVASALEKMTISIAQGLALDGHFRMDVVMNSHGEAFPIELNLLPYLTRHAPNQSYFPLAFELAGTLDYTGVITRIVSHAVARAWGRKRVAELGLLQ